MPLPVINFPAPQAPDLSNLGNLFGNVQKGFEASQAPKRAAEEYLQRILQNQLLRMQTRQAEQDVGLMDMALGRLGMGSQSQGMGGQPPGGGMPMQGGMSNAPMQGSVSGAQNFAGQNQGMFANGIPRDAVLDSMLIKRLTGGTDTFDDKVQVLPSGEVLFWNPKTGKQEVKQLGSRLADIEREKELSKADIKAIEKNYDAYTSSTAQKHGLQGMLKLLETPELSQVVGPFWKNSAAKYFGADKAKEIQAEFNTYAKTIITETAKAFGGNVTNKEMGWIQDVLPKDSDTLAAIRGKAVTLEVLRETVERKTNLKDQLMRQGMNPITADQLAQGQIDMAAIKRMIRPIITLRNKEGRILDIPRTDEKMLKSALAAGYEEGDF